MQQVLVRHPPRAHLSEELVPTGGAPEGEEEVVGRASSTGASPITAVACVIVATRIRYPWHEAPASVEIYLLGARHALFEV